MREFGSLLNFPVNYLSQTPVQIINCSSPIPRRYLCMSTFVHEDEAGDKKDPALLAERWAKAHFIKLLFRRIDEVYKGLRRIRMWTRYVSCRVI